MSKHTILHLSDLHISKFKSDFKEKLYESRTENSDYIDVFCKKVNSIVQDEDLTLDWIIITGDLTNKATGKEYAEVENFLDKLIENLKVKKEKILLIPGNHDIYRSKVRFCHDEDDSKPNNLFFDEKLSSYKEFYEKYTSEKFDCSKSIIFYKEDKENKILFLGMNTLYQESDLHEDHIGYIEKDDLIKCLVKIKESVEDFDTLTKVALFHHPPQFEGVYEKSYIQNWSQIVTVMEEYNIKKYIFGHIHNEVMKKIEDKLYLGTGSFALFSPSITNSFSMYIFQEGKINVQIYDFRNNTLTGQYGIGEWNLCKNQSFDLEQKEDDIISNPQEDLKVEQNVQASPFGALDEEQETVQVEEQNKNISEQLKTNTVLTDNFINKVKEESLFQSGHFHWGNNLKAHGWLNTNKMLRKFKNIQLSINSILFYIKRCNIDVDVIVGIGMEGNILGSIVAINLGVRYTYVPSKEHGKYEEGIDLKDNDKVLFITDTIFTGSTISAICNRYSSQLDKITEKSLICIFCTGNITEIEKKLDNKIKIYSICNAIQIKLCNTKEEECPISKYKLDIIHQL